MTDTTTPAPASTAMQLRSLLAADAQVLLRSRETLALNLLVPIAVLIATDRGKRIGDPGFLIAMAVTFGLLSSALMGYSLAVARDREAGVFQRLRVTPTPTWIIMTSRLVIQFAAAIAAVMIVLIGGSILHRTVFSPGTYLVMFAIALLGAAVFLSIGQALVGLVKSATAVSAIGRGLFILLILTGVLGSSSLLGGTFQIIANWTPVGGLINLFTAAERLDSWSITDTGTLLACIAYALVFAAIGIRWFRWESD